MRPVDDVHSVLPVCSSREVAFLLHWLEHNISLCEVVRFATCLTAWINSFCLPFSSVTVFVVFVVIIVDVVVWVRVFGVTVFVSRSNLSIFSLFSLFFPQATLISVMSWFFTVVARWFGSVSISVCSFVAHSIYLQLIRGFQTDQL